MDSLGLAIVSGELEPGTLLDPVGLEAKHGVSRSLIREVLRSLGSRGLVRATSGQGTFVAQREDWSLLDPVVLRWRYEGRHDPLFLRQLTELRLTIEPTAARFAAARRTDVDIAHMFVALEEMSTAGASTTHVEADLQFHRAVLVGTRNELFENMFVVIEFGLRARDLYVHSSIDLERGADFDDLMKRHRDVLDAVRTGHPRAAELAMRRLLDRSAADIERVQRQDRPDSFAG